jgi:endonuclease YncB( thermonuclease family)
MKHLLAGAATAWFCAAVGAQPLPAPAWTICTSTVADRDGDTFICRPAGGGQAFPVRLAQADAPERPRQYKSRAAHKKLRGLLGPNTQVACYKLDRYGRPVCRVRSASGADVSVELVRAGLAWYAEQWAAEFTAEERALFPQLQAEARGARRGLWGMPDPMPPWVCRDRKDPDPPCR